MERAPAFRVKNLGPILDAKVRFRDLTVLVGPQASGKSVFLQTLKLILDRDHIFEFLKENSMVIKHPWDFINCYFGGGLYDFSGEEPATLWWSGRRRELKILARPNVGKPNSAENVFYIPAQRIFGLQSGATRNFSSFELDEPYVLKRFADQVHRLLHSEFASMKQIFPIDGRLNQTLIMSIKQNLFPDAKIVHEVNFLKRKLMLNIKDSEVGIPFLSWSAGQREFMPLLLGILLFRLRWNHNVYWQFAHRTL